VRPFWLCLPKGQARGWFVVLTLPPRNLLPLSARKQLPPWFGHAINLQLARGSQCFCCRCVQHFVLCMALPVLAVALMMMSCTSFSALQLSCP
jgi:hypothetical protein